MSNKFNIRNLREEDVEQLGELDFVMKLHYLYHGDFDARNLFGAYTGEGELIAAAHLTKHDTFDAVGHEEDKAFKRYLLFDLAHADEQLDDAVKDALLDALLARAQEIKAEYPQKHIVLGQYVDIEQESLEQSAYYLKRGFIIQNSVVILKYDLSQDIPVCPAPEGVEIRPYALDSDEALRNYNQAELAAFDGVAWRLNHLQWMQGAAEMMNFCAFDGERLIGNTSTWRITDERSATENIFVTPDWQKKGVARSIIYTALAHLKQQGKTVATLGTGGTNAKAIRLYTELGYELMGFQLLFGRVIEGEAQRHD